jgi:hypothetical protein
MIPTAVPLLPRARPESGLIFRRSGALSLKVSAEGAAGTCRWGVSLSWGCPTPITTQPNCGALSPTTIGRVATDASTEPGAPGVTAGLGSGS